MFPALQIGKLAISTFGIFLTVGVVLGVFLVWRIARAWDMNEERALDLTLLTVLGGILGARIYFILVNLPVFAFSVGKWLNFQKYPGFSFWGVLLGGFLTLRIFAKKFKVNFWQALDFASVGLLAGLIFERVGCFFGGCGIGITSKLFLAVPMVGNVGSRIPVQFFEAILLYLIFGRIWKAVLHFHIPGTIAASFLIYTGLIMALFTPLHENKGDIYLNLALVLIGMGLFYRITKRHLGSDIKSLGVYLLDIFRKPSVRKDMLALIKKSWYNTSVNLKWKFKLINKALRRINVRFSHKDSKYY